MYTQWVAKTAAELRAQLKDQLKDQQERERQARHFRRLSIAEAGLSNGSFGIDDSMVKTLATNAEGLTSENYSKTDRDHDRRLFDPEMLELDGWTRRQGKWRGLKACPSTNMPASDPETDQSVAELAAGDEEAEQWLEFLTAMADPVGWQARQARRGWLLSKNRRLLKALQNPEYLGTLKRLAGEENRALFEEPLVSDDGWIKR